MPIDSEIDDWQPMPEQSQSEPNDWVEVAPEKSSLVDKAITLGIGLGEGVSFGGSAELAGAYGAVPDYLMNKFQGTPTTLAQSYREGRDYAQKLHDTRKSEDPKLYGGSEITGAVISPINKMLGPVNALASRAVGGAAKAAGAGRIIQAGAKAAGAAAPGGALYGLASSDADLTQGEIGEAAADTATSVGISSLAGGAMGSAAETVRPLFSSAGAKISKIGQELRDLSVEKSNPTIGAAQNTAGISKRIEKTAANLDKTQATPEASILRDLSEGPGTAEGVAKRQAALMSPLTREAKNKAFFEKTKEIYNTVQDNFRNFESKIRFEEAAKNLQSVPLAPVKKAAMREAVMARSLAREMMKEGPSQKLYDQSAAEYLNLYAKQLGQKVSKANTSLEVYKALNEAKKSIANNLMDYGSAVGPSQRGTINAIKTIEDRLSSTLENPEVFGQQALRHQAINKSYSKFLTSLDNMQKAFTREEAAMSGRPIQELSSTSMGTYSRQVHTVHGQDKLRYLEQMIEGAEDLSKTIDTSAYSLGSNVPEGFESTSKLLGNYRQAKTGFEKEMGLSNQLRQLRWDKMVQEGAEPTAAAKFAEGVARAKIPGFGLLKDAADAQLSQQKDMSGLIRDLLNKETQPGAADRAASWVSEGLGKTLQKTPQSFGKFARPLQQAAQRGPQALTAAHHVLMTKGGADAEEYRNIQRQLNGQETPEGR